MPTNNAASNDNSEIQTHYRTCNVCEAMCGLVIQYQDTQILSIKGDQEDPLSKGHICPKGVALQDFYQDPDRLTHPLKKTDKGWEEISWDDALNEIVDKFKSIQETYGNNALGTYLGNPNAHNFGNLIYVTQFLRSLKTKNRYSSASADQLPHHVASNYMLGHGMLVPIPDVDRTDFMLIIGGNPIVSNGSLMTAPGIGKRMKAIQARGGKIVVVDPRRTETALKADEHISIRPNRDALLLAGLIYTLFDENLVTLGHLEDSVLELDELQQAISIFSPEKVSSALEISADKIRSLAKEMANAPSAVCYSRMGASTQEFGGICQWLTNALNILTGNFDSEGGTMFTQPAFDSIKAESSKGKPNTYGRYKSRVHGLPFFNGEFPISTLADEILTEGEGQIKAMITSAGNPVLSSPNGKKLGEAFDSLDFMVSIDIYLNETSRYADIILPAATGIQLSHFDVVFNQFSVRNTVKYSPALFPAKEEQRPDWKIFKELTARMSGKPDDGSTPEFILDMMLKSSAYGKEGMSLEKLKQHPRGIDLGPLNVCLKDRIQTADDKIHIAPALFINDLGRLEKRFLVDAPNSKQFPFELIGRRQARSHNTWTQNSHRLVKGKNPCTLLIHPDDANTLKLSSGEMTQVSSAIGSVEIEIEVSDEMMPGVVSMPQGWGHTQKEINMTIAATQPGVSMNDLTNASNIDTLTGNAVFSGIPVAIAAS